MPDDTSPTPTTRTLTTGPAIGSGFALALNPQTVEQAMKCAEWMSRSDLVPKAYHGKPHDIVIASAMGHRLGLDPFSALAGIAVVNGKPTLYGDAMLAVCQSRADWAGMTVTWDGESLDTLTCTVAVNRKGHGQTIGTFSAEEAKGAGLWRKQGPWSQYPRRMLEMRARSYALRGAYADALAGFHSREEMEDSELIPVSGTVVPEAMARVAPAPVVQMEEQQPAQEQPAPQDQHEPAPAAEQQPEKQAEPAPAAEPTADDLANILTETVAALGGQQAATPILKPIAASLGLRRFSDAKGPQIAAAIAALRAAVAQRREGASA